MYEYQTTGNTNQRDRVAGYLTAQQQSQIETENAINAGIHMPPALLPSNSIATLCNIGNSCYLNSVIYTLRFAPLFLHKLHHLVEEMSQIYQRLGKNKLKISSLGRNVPGLPGANNRSWSSKDLASMGGGASMNGGGGSSTMLNDSPFVPKTSRQIATEKLHELYQNLHHNESLDSLEPYHSGTFLQAIQDVSSIFEGNQQQDAHEFLMCILDTVRETCQSLNKMLAEYPDAICGVTGSAPTITEQLDSNMMAPIKKSSIFSRRPKRKPTQVISTTVAVAPAANQADPVRSNKLDSPMKERKTNTILETDSTDLSLASTSTSVSTVDGSAGEEKDSGSGSGSTVDMSEQIRKMGLDFFRNDFEGVTVSTTKCLTCENVKEKKETMIDISVPITNTENFDSLEHPQFFFQVRFAGFLSIGFQNSANFQKF
jgi:ubiquitin carboxyl-terminal hydrolase 1